MSVDGSDVSAMSIVTVDLVVAVDGSMAGPNVHPTDNPGGDDASRLHLWLAELASWRERQGMEGGRDDTDSRIIGEWFATTGAVVMGRTMYDSAVDFWGDDPPFRVPCFVVTHRPAPMIDKQGGTSYTFVTEGVPVAVALARDAADDRNVDIGGGVSIVRQALRAGLVDEVALHVQPFTIPGGQRWWDDVGPLDLERISCLAGEGADHLRYRVVR